MQAAQGNGVDAPAQCRVRLPGAAASDEAIGRVDDVLGGVLQEPVRGTPVVDATNRFIARGGSWEPDHALRRRIDAVALGRLHCTRVRVAA